MNDPRSASNDTPALLRDAAERSIRYLETLDERPVRPDPKAAARVGEVLGGPLRDEPMEARAVIERLDAAGSPATMAMAGGRFFGFVIGGALPVTVAARWLADVWDQNAGLWDPTPAASAVERIALDWLNQLFELPASTAAGFVTGATVANFTALAAGRHATLKRAGWNVEADGLFGAPPITVVIGDEAHPTLIKSLGLLGLGRSRVVRVPIDGQGRLRAEALPKLDGPSIVCAQAGNVNTGAIDPLEAIADHAAAHGAWLHVDGAFGLWAAASPRLRPLVRGIDRADSIATDAHKWLNVPYDCGIAFTRDEEALRAAMSITADYLPKHHGQRIPSDYTPELSRRARGIEVWAALLGLGRSGVADMIERCCRHARRFADGLRQSGHEILNEVVLNQVLVSFGDPETTRRVIAGIQEDGTCWCGGTVWQGRTAMRISVCSWATTDDDVEKSLAAMVKVAAATKATAGR
jgi:glutamate/tyrosine decarboxylase-like PLP-dependent enzyme